MITDTMTTREILAEMGADEERLFRRLSHELPRWRRWALKNKGRERHESNEWTSPVTKNRWLWGVRVSNPDPDRMGMIRGILRYDAGGGMEWLWLVPPNSFSGLSGAPDLNPGDNMLIRIRSHAWQRLRERWCEMAAYSDAQLVQQVLMTGRDTLFGLSSSRDGQNRTAQHLEHPVRMVVGNGTFLGTMPDDFLLDFRTFITASMERGQQRQVTGQLRHRIAEAE